MLHLHVGLHLLFPSPEQPKQQRQNQADDQAGNQRKMKTEISFAVIDVARQPPQPSLSKTRPEQSADRRNHHPNHHEHFAHLIHPFALYSLNTGASITPEPLPDQLTEDWKLNTEHLTRPPPFSLATLHGKRILRPFLPET